MPSGFCLRRLAPLPLLSSLTLKRACWYNLGHHVAIHAIADIFTGLYKIASSKSKSSSFPRRICSLLPLAEEEAGPCKVSLQSQSFKELCQVPVKAVLPFLEGALRSTGEQRRSASVVKSLRRAENLGVREESVRCKQK